MEVAGDAKALYCFQYVYKLLFVGFIKIHYVEYINGCCLGMGGWFVWPVKCFNLVALALDYPIRYPGCYAHS